MAGDLFPQLFLRFGIFELANALKGPFLAYLLERRAARQVLFVDSDFQGP